MLRALGFDPSNDDIIKLVRELGKNIVKLEEYRIDFQEFLDIMIVKMVGSDDQDQPDTKEDIQKAFDLFKDSTVEVGQADRKDHEGFITKKSLMEVAMELEEDLTEEEIEELIIGAIKKEDMMALGIVRSEDTSKTDKNFEDKTKMVSKANFMSILTSDTNDSKIKLQKQPKSFK